MGRSYLRLMTLAIACSSLAPLVTVVASVCLLKIHIPWLEVSFYLSSATALVLVSLGLGRSLKRYESQIENAAAEQAAFLLEKLPERWLDPAIFTAAGLSLFLELAMILWQATVFPFFAFYKNLSLLSCFAGLGLGYALGRCRLVPLFLTLPLLAWQVLLMTGMRYGMTEAQFHSLYVLPFPEQLKMGLPSASQFYQGLQTYFVLAAVFLLTALAFIPLGQLCGLLMERRDKLTAYGLNLLGSLAGVLLMFLMSAFWTPPALWFLIAFAILLCFHVRKQSVFMLGAASAVVALMILEWPVSPSLQRIYSPYQLLEIGHDNKGLMEIRAAGHYYQKVY